MPYCTNLCCGTAADCPTPHSPRHRKTCLTLQGAEFRCSCHGPYCDEYCDGAWHLPDGRQLTSEEMRAAAGWTGDINNPEDVGWVCKDYSPI